MKTADIPVKDRRYMSDLHFDHKMWLNDLTFYAQELEIFKHRLEEVVERNTKEECTAEAEQFQNKFIREKEVIDILVHEIKEHEKELTQYAKDHPVAIQHVQFKHHVELENRLTRFKELWKELRDSYMNYLTKWM